jgi:hypothetical protein
MHVDLFSFATRADKSLRPLTASELNQAQRIDDSVQEIEWVVWFAIDSHLEMQVWSSRETSGAFISYDIAFAYVLPSFDRCA